MITARGTLVEREEGAVNPDLPTGEVELNVAAGRVARGRRRRRRSRSTRTTPVNEELRLKYRYLDLRREGMASAIKLRHRVVSAIRRHLEDRGFLEIETPVLTRSTPEGARDFLVPSRVAPGSVYALPQSPQIFKQLHDDRRLRALLPDRPLLPRRVLARGPPARVHPARHGALVRGRGGRDRRARPADARGARRRRGGGARPGRADRLRRGDAALRLRPPRSPHPDRDRRPERGVRELGVQGVLRRPARRRRGPRLRRARASSRASASTSSPSARRASARRGWCGAWWSPMAGARPSPSSSARTRSRA